jgi:hypothetical protein
MAVVVRVEVGVDDWDGVVVAVVVVVGVEVRDVV